MKYPNVGDVVTLVDKDGNAYNSMRVSVAGPGGIQVMNEAGVVQPGTLKHSSEVGEKLPYWRFETEAPGRYESSRYMQNPNNPNRNLIDPNRNPNPNVNRNPNDPNRPNRNPNEPNDPNRNL